MSKVVGATMNYKTKNGIYVPLYPEVTKSQIVDWDRAEMYGPYYVTLRQSEWKSNTNIVEINEVTKDDIAYCLLVLTGGLIDMKFAAIDYNCLSSIKSYDGYIEFKCNKKPMKDINLQIWWKR